MSEKDYMIGQKRAFLKMHQFCLNELPLKKRKEFAMERAQTILYLRSICGDYGDNDWEDDLHLEDIIEKHLIRHLALR